MQSTPTIDIDYLIIGAGAMGMAFADEIFFKNPNAKLAIIEQREKPGGHWNNAYPFVTLHQPAAFYGVNSLELGKTNTDLSSRSEILEYYNTIMNTFLKSGRVFFFPNTRYIGNYKAVSLKDKTETQFNVLKKVVDASYMKVEVPATHPPKYKVDKNVTLVPPNGLVNQLHTEKHYYIIGAGKTGIDAILFLLDNNILPSTIHWIVPNEAWLWNRSHLQPGSVSIEILKHIKHLAKANTIDDAFLSMEASGSFFRITKDSMPKKWRCATVSTNELKALRSITQIIRKGRVNHITTNQIHLQEGTITYNNPALFIDCTANGLAKRQSKAIFSGNTITLQSIVFCQQVFSASIIAKLELLNINDDKRNSYAKPVPHPEFKEDWPTSFHTSLENLIHINKLIPIKLFKSRLNFMAHESVIKYITFGIKALQLKTKLKWSVEKWNIR